MGVVGPITEKEVIEEMKEYLREHNIRNYLLFRLGINLGISVPELLHLQVEDVLDKTEFIKGKYRIPIGESLREEISFFLGGRREGNFFHLKSKKTISRFQMYKMLKDTAVAIGFQSAVGALTLRKTFAYWAYKERQIHLPILSKYLGHHTTAYTLRFMGITKEFGEEEVEVYLPDLNL